MTQHTSIQHVMKRSRKKIAHTKKKSASRRKRKKAANARKGNTKTPKRETKKTAPQRKNRSVRKHIHTTQHIHFPSHSREGPTKYITSYVAQPTVFPQLAPIAPAVVPIGGTPPFPPTAPPTLQNVPR